MALPHHGVLGAKNSQRVLDKTKESNPKPSIPTQGTRLRRGKSRSPGPFSTPAPSSWRRQFNFTTFKKLPIRSGFNFRFIAFSKVTSFRLCIIQRDSRGHAVNCYNKY